MAKRFRAAIRTTQFVKDYVPDSPDESPMFGTERGAWERKRKDQRPQAKPEPLSNDLPYSSYQQNAYGQYHQQQPQYGGPSPQYPTQQNGYYNPNGYNPGGGNGGFGGHAPSSGGYGTPPNGHSPPPQNGQYGAQPSSGGDYAAPYGSQSPPSQAGQGQYGQYQNPQNQGYGPGPSYGQGTGDTYTPDQNSHSAPLGQGPFSPPPLTRAVTSPAPRYCSHGVDLITTACAWCRY